MAQSHICSSFSSANYRHQCKYCSILLHEKEKNMSEKKSNKIWRRNSGAAFIIIEKWIFIEPNEQTIWFLISNLDSCHSMGKWQENAEKYWNMNNLSIMKMHTFSTILLILCYNISVFLHGCKNACNQTFSKNKNKKINKTMGKFIQSIRHWHWHLKYNVHSQCTMHLSRW